MKKDNMDITQNSESTRELSGPQELIFKFEKRLEMLSPDQLKIEYKKYSYLCHNYDPYDQSEIENNEVKNILNISGLSEFIANPFEYTNLLLQIMDKCETKIKSLHN